MADSEKIREGLEKLSPNLREILDLTCQGDSAVTIAEKLGMGASTVRRDRSIIRQICEVKTNQEICNELAKQAGESPVVIPDEEDDDEVSEPDIETEEPPTPQPRGVYVVPGSTSVPPPKAVRRREWSLPLIGGGFVLLVILAFVLIFAAPWIAAFFDRYITTEEPASGESEDESTEEPVLTEGSTWENEDTSLFAEQIRYNHIFRFGGTSSVLLAASVRFLYRNDSNEDILVEFDKSNFKLTDNEGRNYQCYTDSTVGGKC